jgi:hypothetical protein
MRMMSFHLLKQSLMEPFQKPLLFGWALASSGFLYLLNIQASLYDIRNPRWVLTMAGIILLSPFFNGGFILLLHARQDGHALSLGKAITRVLPAYGPLVLGELLVNTVVGLGAILFVIPGIYFGLRLIFYKQEMLIAGARGITALRMSIIRTSKWRTTQVLFLYLAVAYLPAALPSIALLYFPTNVLWEVYAVFSSAVVFAWSNTLITRLYLESRYRTD